MEIFRKIKLKCPPCVYMSTAVRQSHCGYRSATILNVVLQVPGVSASVAAAHSACVTLPANMADVEWLSAEQVYEPNANLRNEAHIKSMDEYQRLYKQSVENPEAFWGELAKTFYWKSPPTGKFLEYNFDVNKGPISIKWMQGAVTNVCYNVLDRHVENGLGEKVAFYWYVFAALKT